MRVKARGEGALTVAFSTRKRAPARTRMTMSMAKPGTSSARNELLMAMMSTRQSGSAAEHAHTHTRGREREREMRVSTRAVGDEGDGEEGMARKAGGGVCEREGCVHAGRRRLGMLSGCCG